MTYQESAVNQTIDRLLAQYPDLDASAEGALDNLDQFHAGGPDAVDKLISSLRLGAGDRVLDVGSGFGGPARQIARRTGNRVTGIDITAAYVEAARELTVKAGLHTLVGFHTGDIAAFEPSTPYQAAITMHVQMNVPDKSAWFAHIARCLAPGARLAVWEVCRPQGAGDAPHPLPMPWSLDGSDSFVVAGDELRTEIEQAGFTTIEWANETRWVNDWFAATFANGLPDGPALPMLIEDGYTRVLNYAGALAGGGLEVWRGTFAADIR